MAKSERLRQLDVQLPMFSYPIWIGDGVLSDTPLISQYIAATHVLIVTNETVAPLYLERLMSSLTAFQTDVLILPDGEAYKNQNSLMAIYDALIQNHHHRDTTLMALGGGVMGDLVGFAASTYQRGVRYIQCPTTLLAQVDASVGGKTAINHPLGKNMIGSFYQPTAVLMDLDTLETLPEREWRAGLAEVIKYAALKGGDLLALLTKAISSGNIRQIRPLLQELVYQCCAIKAEFVEADEHEEGLRALLNLGHTVGHALEAITEYQCWLHGEAVAIGLYCAALLSHRLGYLPLEAVNQLDQLLAAVGLPRRIPRSLDIPGIVALMQRDKKVKQNRLRFVLMNAFGDCFLAEQVPEDVLYQVLYSAVEGGCK